jgi:hypothetical protein
MECVPCVREVALKDADPLASVDVPKTVAPSRNWTVPVAVEGDTVAVNVTDAPTVDGFRLLMRVVVVTTLFTVCESAADVLPAQLVSPL